MRQIITLVFALCINYFSFSTVYYSDPVNGSMSNPGTSTQPWGNLEAIFNAGQIFNAGDVILLRDGNHGFPKINGINTGYIDIQAQAGHSPIINRIYIGNVSATSYWRLTGVTIQTINVSTFPISLITLYPSTSNIVIQNCTIQSTNNTTTYTRDDWRTKTNHGINAEGSNHIIQNNTITNVAVGISCEAPNTLINQNTIQYFTIDGIRGLASDCIYQNNTVMDNIVVFTYAENHYDGFQAYTCCPVGSDTIKNVILRQNLIINTTDTTRQWRGPMQGMVGFDGYFENWTIENNVIMTDHWHGITLLGAINCRIINNTCVDPYDISPIDPYDTASTAIHGPPWVSIKAHKNGSLSFNNTIQNNIVSTLNNDTGIGTVSHNILIGASSNYTNHFVDYLGLDYHLIPTSTAIDAGVSTFAPSVDYENVSRPQGTGYDAGAYEYVSAITTTQSISICDGENYMIGTSVYTTTGVYSDTLSAQNGQDSIVITNLTVNPVYNINIVDSICSGQTYTVGTSTYSQNGNYTDVLSTINGCDSIINLTLTVTTITVNLNNTICNGESYTVGTSTYMQSGTYSDILATVNGCDSIVNLTLTVNPTYNMSILETICNGQSYSVGTSTYTQGGIYTDTLSTINGCDSVIITDLTVVVGFEETNVINLCGGETYTVGQHAYNQTGNYIDTLIAIGGCDSIIHTDLTVDPVPIDVSISTNGLTLTANASNQTYQWINCNDNSSISGETNQSFTVQQNGNYAVIITNANNCSDTSICVLIEDVGLEDNSVLSSGAGLSNGAEIYPNPNTGQFTLSVHPSKNQKDWLGNGASLTIYNQLGQVVFKEKIILETQSIQTNLPQGTYQIVIRLNDKIIVKRLIIK